MVICFKVASDFEPFLPIAVNNRADLRLFPADDKVTLEYNDRVMLTFNPRAAGLIPGLENVGEYIRDSAIVNIIDNDRKPNVLEIIMYILFSWCQCHVWFSVSICE